MLPISPRRNPMKAVLRAFFAAGVLAVPLATSSCATIAGTAVSPITGGVNLSERYLDDPDRRSQWYWVPFVFLGGVVSGPFVALYNGIRHDVSIFNGWHRYWRDFGDVFAPFDMVNKRWEG
jgi:hypothetical protein